MNDEHTEVLYDRFQSFLTKDTLPDGLVCEDGWYQLLFDMFQAIANVNPPSDFRVTKVFERFGELRIYSVNGNCATRLCISEAIDLACDVCQWCGDGMHKCERCKEAVIEDYTPDIAAAITPKVE
jgi:hypothetical protein